MIKIIKKCDIFIFCDGLNSKIRKYFFNNKNKLNYLNVAMINGIISINNHLISIFKQSIIKINDNYNI